MLGLVIKSTGIWHQVHGGDSKETVMGDVSYK